MAIIKKPIRKILYYLSSLLGIIFALVAGFIFKNSSHNLSQLEDKTKELFATGSVSLISSVKTAGSKVTNINTAQAQTCWTPFGGGGGGCGDGCGSASASCGCSGCADSSASSSDSGY